ncbi:MAG: nitrilase-related carbon-nitrogen hydrolase [Ilumatobacter sp.]|uniref:nitrilase-related carbon-nitrogen hydrolase n=1 Tax=Ilumatobacter sp. TaxID=1967498 RepID=UPI00329A1E5C
MTAHSAHGAYHRPRELWVGAAQLGPIARDESRADVVDRLLLLLRQGAEYGCELVVFPELALTSFFPRWILDGGGNGPISGDTTELDSFYEVEMPSTSTQRLFDEAKRLAVGFCLGYAELTPPDADGVRHRYNTYVLVDRDGEITAKYRKVHIPGHEAYEPWRQFQHLERRYFEESPDGFGVHNAFGGRIGMAICNDRRWPETYRVMGLQGVEMVLIGYNTPLNYAPDPSQNPLQAFHNHLVMQAGAYQNGTWVIGVAKGGVEEGVESLAQTSIIAPSGQIVAQATTIGDELITARCDLDMCERYKKTLFDFDRYRRPEMYSVITDPTTKSLVETAARERPDFDRHDHD